MQPQKKLQVMQYEIAIQAAQEAGMDISNVMPQELIKLFIDQTLGLTAEDTGEMETGEMQGVSDIAPQPFPESTKGRTLTQLPLTYQQSSQHMHLLMNFLHCCSLPSPHHLQGG